MNIHALSVALMTVLFVAGCANVDLPSPAHQGPIPEPGGGVPGYQHGGGEGTKFAIGQNLRRTSQYGYLKQIGDEGTLAIRYSNGSVFGVPNAQAASLKLPPYGASPIDHGRYVRDYFVRLGLPTDQIEGVRNMTLLEASGRADETEKTIPRVTAYYSVLTRSVGDVTVPDSFAWARANSEGAIVQEGVYWPPLPSNVLSDARKLERLLVDPAQRRVFASRSSIDPRTGKVAIRHAAANEDQFDAFASLDITVRSSVSGSRQRAAAARNARVPLNGGTTIVKHFGIDGVERFLPQESLNLIATYPGRKDVSR
jgi:hypothetical protein